MQFLTRSIYIFMYALTVALWAAAKVAGDGFSDTWLVLAGQLAALLAVVSFFWNFFLAARFKWVDKLYGGLDKVFKAHKISGILAFCLILFHPLAFAINALPFYQLVKRYLLPSGSLTLDTGVIALYGIIILVALTFVPKIKYHVWKNTHRFMGLFFLVSGLHIILIRSDVSEFIWLRIWILALVVLSVLLWVYKSFFYGKFKQAYQYVVDEIKTMGDVIEIWLKPTSKQMVFTAGQYVFLSFPKSEIGGEEHVFSFSSAPTEKRMRFSIGMSGDYTKGLIKIKKGDKAKLTGPFGYFGEKILTTKQSVWLAGGIGVTPFLSVLRHLAETGKLADVIMFYCVRNQDDDEYLSELRSLAKKIKGLKLICAYSDKEGFMTARKVQNSVKDLKDRKIFVCGPVVMMRSLQKGFMELGKEKQEIIFEDFSLR